MTNHNEIVIAGIEQKHDAYKDLESLINQYTHMITVSERADIKVYGDSKPNGALIVTELLNFRSAYEFPRIKVHFTGLPKEFASSLDSLRKKYQKYK